jgi:hypothetical protein
VSPEAAQVEEWETSNALIGRPAFYPNFGCCRCTMALQTERSSSYEVDVEFEKAVFVTAVEIFETRRGGGVRFIKVRDGEGDWVYVYATETIECLEAPRRFVPEIERPSFKTNALRIVIDTSKAAPDPMSIDAIGLYGYEREHAAENIAPVDLIAREFPRLYDDELERDEPVYAEMKHNPALLKLKVSVSERIYRCPNRNCQYK